LLNVNISLASTAGLGAVFMLGLVAASSSCVAVSGGLLLSSAASFNFNHPSNVPLARMRPVFMFVAGRIASYTLFGGLIGLVGAALAPSSTVTGAITVAAAIYMLIVGLEMLRIAPSWLRAILPRMPKSLARRMMDAQGHAHPVAPFLLGAATFFIPCGFTQALQVYALTTGSFATSALMLMMFALGTAPALLALGWASSALKGKAGSFFFRLSGALVVVMGLWNIQNGMTAMGYPLSLPRFAPSSASAQAADPNVRLVNGVQVIRMRLSVNPAYAPSDTYTVKAGVPVRMEIEGIGTGCRGILQVPRARAKVALTKPLNVLEFTPKSTGDYSFSCAMGMFPGVLHAI
jgi:sulfite exporter TauE/SafE